MRAEKVVLSFVAVMVGLIAAGVAFISIRQPELFLCNKQNRWQSFRPPPLLNQPIKNIYLN
jgi:hypothetical protein